MFAHPSEIDDVADETGRLFPRRVGVGNLGSDLMVGATDRGREGREAPALVRVVEETLQQLSPDHTIRTGGDRIRRGCRGAGQPRRAPIDAAVEHHIVPGLIPPRKNASAGGIAREGAGDRVQQVCRGARRQAIALRVDEHRCVGAAHVVRESRHQEFNRRCRASRATSVAACRHRTTAR